VAAREVAGLEQTQDARGRSPGDREPVGELVLVGQLGAARQLAVDEIAEQALADVVDARLAAGAASSPGRLEHGGDLSGHRRPAGKALLEDRPADREAPRPGASRSEICSSVADRPGRDHGAVGGLHDGARQFEHVDVGVPVGQEIHP